MVCGIRPTAQFKTAGVGRVICKYSPLRPTAQFKDAGGGCVVCGIRPTADTAQLKTAGNRYVMREYGPLRPLRSLNPLATVM